MQNFFTSIVYISIATLVIFFYFAIKNLWFQWRKKKIREKIWRRLYDDEKYWVRNSLKYQLKQLMKGNVRWILVFLFEQLSPNKRFVNVKIISSGG